MASATPAGRIQWIDTAKGLGLLFVFIGHLGVPGLSTWVYTFYMPLFFFLAGVVFSNRKSTGSWLQSRFMRLVVPYFVLGMGIYIFWSIVYLCEGRPAADYWEMLRDFVVQRHFWTVWFLAALFVAQVLYLAIVNLCRDRLWLVSAVSLLLSAGVLVAYRFGLDSLPWNIDVAVVSLFFLNLGYVVKRRPGWLQMKPRVAVLVTLALLAVNVAAGYACIRVSGQSLDMSIGMYGNEPLTLISAMAGIGAVVAVSQIFSHRFISWLGRNTMILFAWHSRIILAGCGMIYASLDIFQGGTLIDQTLAAALTLVIILGVLIPVTLLIKRTRHHALFGV